MKPVDRDLLLAIGKALAIVGALLQRAGVAEAEEFGHLLGTFAVITAETDPAEGDILAIWASIVKDSAEPRAN